ncbi:hypothetical protein [Luteibaculum oceani]|uniref:Uncharacterized protein n=1 Tax=Luteibaculum oceani TaxID=1294296 RepID=A0A5C6V8N5_9FLAO|nr:hypothetical protein [Luteibaculum oceani]TXC81429.1 hypothetical protein FRX97_05330 [Luteibaculum oceani]
MPNGRWLNVTLCILLFIVFGYLRHILILHANVVLGQSTFEFPRERITGVIQVFQAAGDSLIYIEKGFQIFFLLISAFISWVLLDALKIGVNKQKTFLIIFFALALTCAVLSLVLNHLNLSQYAGLLSTFFVKFQGPLPVIVFYLLHRGAVV